MGRSGRLVGPLVEWVEANPIDFVDWLPGQQAFNECPSRMKLFRAGNQAQGKTWAGIRETWWRARGIHPYRQLQPRARTGWIVSGSGPSSRKIQEKLWNLIPHRFIHPHTTYDPLKGAFYGHEPMVKIRSIHGGWSTYHFKWTTQRGLSLASATVDDIWFDEPPMRRRAFTEAERRTTRTGGDIYLTLTPVNAPVESLKDMCESGVITDHHYPLRPEYLIPDGLSEPLYTDAGECMDQDWIDAQRKIVAPYEAPVVLDGEWEFRMEGNAFEAFDPHVHVIEHLSASRHMPATEVQLLFGIDYGDDAFRLCAALVAVDDSREHPRILILDEYIAQGPTLMDEDAIRILEMLKRNRLKWRHLDHAHGDKRYTGAAGLKDLTTKSNRELATELAALLRIPRNRLSPPVRSAKRGRGAGRGSVHAGVRFLHEAMVRAGCFYIDKRCEVTIEALGKWAWGEKYKDPIDALRYACKPLILPQIGGDFETHQIHIRRS